MFNVTYINQNDDSSLDEYLKEYDIDYTAFYRGIVINNNDPLNLGRVQVRIPQLYGNDISDESFVSSAGIPWATPATLPAGNDSGSYLIPNNGDIVFVTFEGGDSKLPMYFGGLLTNRGDTKSIGSSNINDNVKYTSDKDDLNTEVVHGTERVIYKSLKGATIIIDDYDGGESLKIIDQSGQSIIMENTSEESLPRRGNSLGRNTNSHIVISNNAGDSISLSRGQIHIKSPNIILESDNIKQIKTDEYSFENEIALANIIIGTESPYRTLTLEARNVNDNTNIPYVNYRITNPVSGEVLSGTTDESGKVSIQAITNIEYTIVFTKENYFETTETSIVTEDVVRYIYMTPSTEIDVLKAVLTWGSTPNDLDSHTKEFDSSNSQTAHVYYSNKTSTYINLDLDDTTSYGPETTTITDNSSHKYMFFVHNFTNDGCLYSSNATVIVYRNGNVLNTFSVPTESTSDGYWYVFNYDGNGTVTEVNKMYSTEPSVMEE